MAIIFISCFPLRYQLTDWVSFGYVPASHRDCPQTSCCGEPGLLLRYDEEQFRSRLWHNPTMLGKRHCVPTCHCQSADDCCSRIPPRRPGVARHPIRLRDYVGPCVCGSQRLAELSNVPEWYDTGAGDCRTVCTLCSYCSLRNRWW